MKLYISNSEEKRIKGVAKFEKLNASELEQGRDFKTRNEQETKDRWVGKSMHGQFIGELSEAVDKEKTWQWLSKCDLKAGTEALICAAQKQSIRAN